MADFTVASTTQDSSATHRGQSLAPNIAGPNGSGGPGTANPVYLEYFNVGYPNGSLTGRAAVCYVYDTLPTLANLNAGTGAIATSTGTSDGNDFGSGSFTRNFIFGGDSLDPTKTYFILFPADQLLCHKTNPYSGGVAYTNRLMSTSYDLQFETGFNV